MALENRLPVGYRWRSSSWFIISCIAIALFSENFLFSYIVPILQVMLEDRLHVDKSQTQAITSLVLSANAFVSMVTGLFIGHLADKIPNRRHSLLMALGAEMVGTVTIMLSPSVMILLIGRTLQGIGGNAVWIVGLATLADTVGQDKTGRTLGGISSFYASGLLFGPLTSGVLLQSAGYWVTWMVAIAVLVVDMIMRIVMIEKKSNEEQGTSGDEDTEASQTQNMNDPDEQTSLLHSTPTENCNRHSATPASTTSITNSAHQTATHPTSSPENFWKFILTNTRALTAVACHCTLAIILLSLDTTLPLHASRTFGWDTAQVSFMFLLLQFPALFLATLMGMLKDRFGTRFLTGLGYFTTGFCIWLLGMATKTKPDLVGSGDKGQSLSMIALVGIGISRSFISGSGLMEITNVMKDAQKEKPGRFGPNGKMSSAYSVTNLFWNAGKLLGPIISGSLTRIVGYYYMNSVIASLCCVVGVLAWLFLDKR